MQRKELIMNKDIKYKIIGTIVIFLILYTTSILFHQIFIPTNVDDLAISQIKEDGSREQLRSIEEFSNFIDPMSIILFILSSIYLWKSEIKYCFKKIVSSN